MTHLRFLVALCMALVLTPVYASAEETCDTPMDMVIISIVHDVERYNAYRSSLIELGTIEQFGGRVITVGTRLVAEPEMFEGEWPENRHSFVIRWPCAAAAHAFWQSDSYQKESLPLRVGAGTYDIALFPALAD